LTPLALPPALTATPIASATPVARPQAAKPEDTAGAPPSFDAVRQTIAKSGPSSKTPAQSPTPDRATEAPPILDLAGQILAAVLPKPASVPAAAPALADDVKGTDVSASPSLPDPAAPALIVTLPPLQLVAASPASAGTRAIQSAPAAEASTRLFFPDAASSPIDAADVAEDLIAALTSATASPLVADPKALAKADAPVIIDPRPKLDMTSDAWLDQLARDITASASSDSKLSFRIVPPQLGRLDIAIETRDAGMAVHVKAETREAHLLIANAQHRLEEALSTQGLRVTETSVTSNGGGDLPQHHFMPQEALIEAVTETKREADAPTTGRDAGRFA
jgi:flagellar hook-length control protein FliK